MTTDCFGARAFDFSDTEAVFFQGSLSLLKVIIPAVICVLLWKLLVARKVEVHQRPDSLGLSEIRSDVNSARGKYVKILLQELLMYIAIASITFTLGLLSHHVYERAAAIAAK